MTPLSKGDRVIYIPDHADGPDSKYAEKGVVTQVRSTGVLVKYFDGSPNAKHTKRRLLKRVEPSAPYE
jgi:hypothetical protein